MKKKYSPNTQYVGNYFILVLLNKFYYIFAISIFFGIFFFAYNKNFNKDLKLAITNIIIKNPTVSKFDIYNETNSNNEIKSNQNNNFTSIYFFTFKNSLNSKDNFHKFLDQYAISNNLNEKEILFLKKYKNLLFIFEQSSDNKSNSNLYFLKYPKQFNGPEILRKYILYTSDKTTIELIENLKFQLESKFNYLNNPQKKINFDEDVTNFEKYKFLVKNLNLENLRINIILDDATIGRDYDNEKKYFFIGAFIGFFLSIIFFLFRFISLDIK